MEEETSKKYDIGNGAPFVAKARWANNEETYPLRSEKRSGQILLTFDAWFESTRGERMGRESRGAKRSTGLFGKAFFKPVKKAFTNLLRAVYRKGFRLETLRTYKNLGGEKTKK